MHIVDSKGALHHEQRARIVRAVEVGMRKPMTIARENGLGVADLIEAVIAEKSLQVEKAYQNGYRDGRRSTFPLFVVKEAA